MTIEIAEFGKARAQVTGHAQAIANARARAALLELSGRAADMPPDQLGIALKASIREHHRARSEMLHAPLGERFDANAGAVAFHQRLCRGAAENRAAALREIAGQCA